MDLQIKENKRFGLPTYSIVRNGQKVYECYSLEGIRCKLLEMKRKLVRAQQFSPKEINSIRPL